MTKQEYANKIKTFDIDALMGLLVTSGQLQHQLAFNDWDRLNETIEYAEIVKSEIRSRLKEA